MYKVILLAALAISAAYAQESAQAGSEAAAEPYSYGYETDSHAASEQRDPSGRVTGFYTLADADGRQRRVEYFADESGFHAKVQTNEVGTKSENSADVEVLAAPPTQEQYIYRQQEQQQVVQVPVQQQQRVVTQQVVAAPAKSTTVAYVQQPNTYAYNQGYSYYPSGSAYYSYPATGYQQYGYNYAPGYTYGTTGYGTGYGTTGYGTYSSYNNHLPSSYYKSLNTVQAAPAVARTGYYQTSQVSAVPVNTGSVSYRSAGNYQTVGVPAGAVTYQTVGVPAGSVSYQTSSGYPSTVSSSSSVGNLLGSSNYQLIKKREAAPAAAAAAEQK